MSKYLSMLPTPGTKKHKGDLSTGTMTSSTNVQEEDNDNLLSMSDKAELQKPRRLLPSTPISKRPKTAPSVVKPSPDSMTTADPKARTRAISLRSISPFIHHSRPSSSASSTPSSNELSPPEGSPLPTASSMKDISRKVAAKVKKSIKHLSHVTRRSRSSSSPATVDISHHPSFHIISGHKVSPSLQDSRSSNDTWAANKDKVVHFQEDQDQRKREREPVQDSEYALQTKQDRGEEVNVIDEMSNSATSARAPNVTSAEHSAEEVGDTPPFISPSESAINTAVYVEPDVPDPFLVDEEGDALSEGASEEGGRETSSEPPAHEIALGATSTATLTSPTSPLQSPLNVNKDVPPTPSAEDQEEDVPDLFLPGLIIQTMFLPIPNTDPLTTLLTKYIYPPEKRPVRDLTGDWKRSDVHTLVMTNSWRSLARMARDRIVFSNPADVEEILGLWYLRLASLARLRLSNQTAAECTNLFAVLNAIEPIEARQWVFERVIPFELEVMHARIKYWAGDHMGYLDALSGLLRKCKRKAREAVNGKEEDVQDLKGMWKERGARVCLILASQLVEMKDFTAAANLLEPLCNQPPSGLSPNSQETITNPALRSAVARIYLQSGNVQLARYHFSLVAQDPAADEALKRMNEAMLGIVDGEWDESVGILRTLIERDAENYVAVNNLSVALLSQGKLKEAIDVLEEALKSSPSTIVVAEPFLFNLSTLYELRSAAGLEKKQDLLIQVAQWGGDGLRTNCLKMPTT